MSIILAGDIGADVESTLATRIPPAPVRVLKIPHHGSLHSSTHRFVDAMSPAVAVVSTGRHNAFGHPNPEVLRRYAEVGAVVLQTPEVGAVSVRSDGRRVVVETQRGQTFVVGSGSAALHRGRGDARRTRPDPSLRPSP